MERLDGEGAPASFEFGSAASVAADASAGRGNDGTRVSRPRQQRHTSGGHHLSRGTIGEQVARDDSAHSPTLLAGPTWNRPSRGPNYHDSSERSPDSRPSCTSHRRTILSFASSLASRYSTSPCATLAVATGSRRLRLVAFDISTSRPLRGYPTVALAAVWHRSV